MDPLSQGVVGVTVPQALLKKNQYMGWGFLFSFLAGMAPDLDVVIRSSTDPLLFLEYHRQFTHSLAFIPIGGFICAVFFHFSFRYRMPFKLNYIYSVLGYGTHGLLDACTTYGTQLFWPFTNERVSWNNISIIDPLFTLPLLVLIIISLVKRNPFISKVALVYGLSYLLLGVVQRERAMNIGWEIAKERQHQVVKMDAKSSFANLLLWKVIYQTEDRYYVDAVKVGFKTKIYPGDSLQKLNIQRDLPWLAKGSQQMIDLERFRWFSQGYLAKDPHQDDFVFDVRYSIVPNEINGLWGIRLSRFDQDKHISYEATRDLSSKTRADFFKMLFD